MKKLTILNPKFMLVTPEVFNAAVKAASLLNSCNGDFNVYCNNFLVNLPTNHNLDSNTKASLRVSFNEALWYIKTFPLSKITLGESGSVKIDLQSLEEVKQYLMELHESPDRYIDQKECEQHISCLEKEISKLS
jgi:hypothetical protein